ncbi:type VII secretion integral membrane protein EccD [Nocardia aurantiaca]|uniref:Type VII secretion integral membrane protein EccD n=1 Tax=Nocardia aurantiaca TaxID=2675850 RepID=A0A6I3KU65_9NOCA|nr:type VII secretion integral membrane protein EccD [Nocardia aurantiaca]MTE11614.1 type VII secretion integral membrane protein EccD [Nocardia aurantiaca]
MTHSRTDHLEELRGTVRAPDLARVTILAKHTQVDMAIPVDVPVALVIPSVVDMVDQHNRANDFDHDGEQLEPREWVLARIGRPPFSNSLSLAEQGVRDGELLMLENAEHIAPTPLFDDIMYNVAIADADHFRGWTPRTARLTGSVLAVAISAVGCFGLLAAPTAVPGRVGAAVATFVTLLLVIASMVLSRMYHDRASALVLGGCALPTAFSAGMLFVPSHYGWANALLGAVLAGATAIVAWRVSGVGLGLFIGVTTLAVFAIPAALVGLLTSLPVHAIGGGAAALSLAGLSLAPRLSMLLAELPLPPVPAPGTPLDPTEDDPDDHRALPTMEVLRAKSERAREYLAGLVAATTMVVAAGAVAGVDPIADRPYRPGLALALVCAAVLMLRSRTYAGAEPAVVLIAGGTAIVLLVLIGAALTQRQPLTIFGVALLLSAAALVLGIIAPRRQATPPLRRAVELLEYGFVAAVVPLTFWVADLYSLVREL